MNARIIRCAAAAILAVLVMGHGYSLAHTTPREQAAQSLSVSAGGAVLIEAGSNKVLYSVNPHRKLPMASTTKVMTALLAIENCDLDTLFTVPDEAYGIEGSSIYLEKDEQISVRDLLYGLMLSSGNDAAVTLAINIGGSVQGFADMMNERAKIIGANNTNFITPNGLHNENHYTTAYDLALICSEAMRSDDFRTIVGTTYHKTTTGNHQRTLKNKNKILWQYDGGNGIKTGYTKDAGKCLTFAAVRGEMQLIGVVLNCYDMFPSAMKLMDYGFENYEMLKLVSADQVVGRAYVQGAKNSILAILAKEDIMIPVRKNSQDAPSVRIDINESLSAPIKAGETVGVIEVWEGETLLARKEALAERAVSIRDMKYYLERLISGW